MPCRDSGPSDYDNLRDRNDQLARMLCSTLNTLSKSQINKLPKEIQQWWILHQKEDKKREEAQQLQVRRAVIKAKALAKLSNEEIAILNLR